MGKNKESTDRCPPTFTSAVITQAADDGRVTIDLDTRLARSLAKILEQPEPEDLAAPPAYTEQDWSVHLNIVVQVIGSRGDVQPFIALGQELQRMGHRIRIATHARFKTFVKEAGLEFYPVGGDPADLMAYMVQNPGILPQMSTVRSGEIGKKRRTLATILEGCWKSCISPDLDTHAPFVANAIIANPPSFAHIHCAQALGVPYT